jgi:hypothetical protein
MPSAMLGVVFLRRHCFGIKITIKTKTMKMTESKMSIKSRTKDQGILAPEEGRHHIARRREPRDMRDDPHDNPFFNS